MSKEIGLRIKKLRSDYGLKVGQKITQKDLAEKIGRSRSFVGDIESGRTEPSEDLLKEIAEALDASIEYILDDKVSAIGSVNEERNTYISQIPETFTNAKEAREYLKLYTTFGSEGLTINNLDDEEAINFANEILDQIKLVGYKYKK